MMFHAATSPRLLHPIADRISWTDTYGVEIADGEDDVLILASTVVIDMVCHGDQKGGRH
jgi:uncharacterized protein YxjI